MNRHLHFAILTTLLLVALLPVTPVAAQQPSGEGEGDTATIEIGDQARALVRLAFPKAKVDLGPGVDPYASQELEQTLRDDLEYTRIFSLQGPTELSVLTLRGERGHDFEQFRSLGNEVVLLVDISGEDQRLVLEARLYDLPSGQSILGKRYRGEPEQARRIAHTLADALYRQFTGRPGIALTSIAFHSDRDGDGRTELYLMDYDGHNQRRISRHRSTSGFSDWSPSGDAIAYMSYFTGPTGVHYVDLESSQKITVYDQGTLTLSPSFSPDGRQLAFAHSRDSNVDIYVCGRQCESPRRVTESPKIDTNPAWSPDGTKIAFTSDRAGKPNIYVMDVDGTDVRRISFEGDYNDGACWHPDGQQIVYASRRGYKFHVTVTSLVDLGTRTLTQGSESYEEPCYSPDGRRIVFTVKRGRQSQIHVMDAGGGDWRQLTFDGNNMAADWSNFAER